MKRTFHLLQLAVFICVAASFSNSHAGGKSGILGEWYVNAAAYPLPRPAFFLTVSCYANQNGDNEIVAEAYNKDRIGNHYRYGESYTGDYSTNGGSKVVAARYPTGRLAQYFGEGFSIGYAESTDQLVLQVSGTQTANYGGRSEPEQLSFTYQRVRNGSPCPKERRNSAPPDVPSAKNETGNTRDQGGPTTMVFFNRTQFELNIYYDVGGGDCRYMQYDGTIAPNRQARYSVEAGEIKDFLFTTCSGPCGTDCNYDYSGNFKEFRCNVKGGSGQTFNQDIY